MASPFVPETRLQTEITETIQRRAGFKLWLLWVLANTAAVLLTWALSAGVNALLVPIAGSPRQDLPNWNWASINAVASVTNGAVFGIAQWLILRRYLAGMAWQTWTLATALGYLLTSVTNFFLFT